MTDRAAPGAQGSTLRNVEHGEAMNSLHDGYIVPSNEPTISSQRYADLNESAFNDFNASWSGSSLDVTIDPGEAFIEGWLATDDSHTVTLNDFEDGQTIILGWDADAVYDSSIHSSRQDADRIIIKREQDLTVNIPYIPIWTFDTDGDGVIQSIDERNIGSTVTASSQRLKSHVGSVEQEEHSQRYYGHTTYLNTNEDEYVCLLPVEMVDGGTTVVTSGFIAGNFILSTGEGENNRRNWNMFSLRAVSAGTNYADTSDEHFFAWLDPNFGVNSRNNRYHEVEEPELKVAEYNGRRYLWMRFQSQGSANNPRIYFDGLASFLDDGYNGVSQFEPIPVGDLNNITDYDYTQADGEFIHNGDPQDWNETNTIVDSNGFIKEA